jgi:hypothetical protein
MSEQSCPYFKSIGIDQNFGEREGFSIREER